ncbi:MAG: acyl-CoA dehydrogenase family protein [Betaproteobacteria bacterium]|jgi:acyl-CoA dehydrogenase
MTYEFKPRWFDRDVEEFNETVERFLDTEMVPNDEQARIDGHVGHDIWRKAGALGLLCTDIPTEYGGAGADYRYEAVLHEAMGRKGLTGMSPSVHSIIAHYFLNHGTEDQKSKYLPRLANGSLVGAIAMTEPNAGSDLKGIKTKASFDGEHYVLNGSKTFITNGYLAELILVFSKVDSESTKEQFSIFILETSNQPGFSVGRRLKKIGLKAQDTSELFFDNVRLTPDKVLGGEIGKGLHQLMADLPYERLIIANMAMGAIEGAYRETVDYVSQRKAFGQAISSMQHTRFVLADIVATLKVARSFVDDCVEQLIRHELDTETASAAKLWLAQQQNRIVDECVQLHGGYGFMEEYQIGRMYSDARVQRIYGGTDEIMKEIISRKIF